MSSLLADARFALRWMRRSPGFTATAVGSIAVAIGIYTALFAVVDALLFRPLPGRSSDRLVTIYTSGSDGAPWNTTSYPDLMDLRQQGEAFDDLAGHSAMLAAVSGTERSRLTLGEIVTGNYFHVLGVAPALGRALLPSDDRRGAERVAMISHAYWIREFGGAHDAVGRSLRLRGESYAIVGVAPRGFTGMTPILAPEIWVTTSNEVDVEPAGIIDVVPSTGGTNRLDRRGYRWLFVTGRLKPAVTVDGARAQLDTIVQRLAAAHPATNKDRRASMLPVRSVRLHPQADRAIGAAGAGLMLAVGLVLLVACANVAGMLLARASARQREIAVRRAVGATRARLVRQLLTESTMVALFGAAGGVAVAAWLIRAIPVI